MMNKYFYIVGLFAVVAIIVTGCSKKITYEGRAPAPVTTVPVVKSDVTMWLTTGDKTALLQKQNISLLFNSTANQNTTITVDTTQTYQTIDGFGFTLTGGSATLINNLGTTQRDALLKELFLTDSSHIGISYLRISIGASDLSTAPFTYDDLSSGESIVTLRKANINLYMLIFIRNRNIYKQNCRLYLLRQL